MSEILYHANLGLQNESKNREDLVLFVGSGSSPEGIRKIQQHEYPLW